MLTMAGVGQIYYEKTGKMFDQADFRNFIRQNKKTTEVYNGTTMYYYTDVIEYCG